VAVSVLKVPITANVKSSNASIRRAIMSSMARLLNRRWAFNQGLHAAIRRDLSTHIFSTLQQTDTYRSLIDSKGTLRTQFGLQYKEAQVDPIILKASQSVDIVIKPFRSVAGSHIRGGITIGMLEINFEQDLANEPTASFISEKDKLVPWVKWLLTEGDRIAVADYTIKTFPQRSRTRSLIMVKPTQGTERNYRVPPEYSGTVGKNFITEALDDEVTVMGEIIKRRLQGAL